MGHAFKCHLLPSDASVTQECLVRSSYSAGYWININGSSVTMTTKVITEFWPLIGESCPDSQFSVCCTPKVARHCRSQFRMKNHVIWLKGATIFRKAKPENYKSHISWKISISLWVWNLFLLDVIFVIIIQWRQIKSNLMLWPLTCGYKKPGPKCLLTKHVTVY